MILYQQISELLRVLLISINQHSPAGTVEKSGGNGELVYSGSAVKHGEATGIVYATGTRTYFGRSVELVEPAN